MAAAKSHTLLKFGSAAAAAFAGYEFIWKPWKAGQDAALIASAGTGAGLSYTPTGGGGGFSLPYVTSPVANVGATPSNLDPGAAVGGPTGTCMHRKGWTQTQCETRLNALVTGFQQATAVLSQLQSGGAVTGAQAALTANQTALQQAMQAYNAALAANDAAGANQWKAAIDAHNADISALQARITSVPAQITAIQNEIAGLAHDYLALTGLSLV